MPVPIPRFPGTDPEEGELPGDPRINITNAPFGVHYASSIVS